MAGQPVRTSPDGGTMSKRIFTACVFSLLLGVQATHVASNQGLLDGPKREVEQMEKQWREAWVRGDAVALDQIHAEDYLVINYLGQMNDKSRVMADVRAGEFKYEGMEHKDVVMRVYGEVVVVNGRTINKGHRRDRDVSGEFSYTRVYVKRAGRWQAVLSQYTRPATQ
jgi:ketosteroid isomerase-like protein